MAFGIAHGEETIQGTTTMIYCGSSGGYQPSENKFPINTRAKARAALSYAYWAPNPEGIRECVCLHYPDFPSCIKRKERHEKNTPNTTNTP